MQYGVWSEAPVTMRAPVPMAPLARLPCPTRPRRASSIASPVVANRMMLGAVARAAPAPLAAYRGVDTGIAGNELAGAGIAQRLGRHRPGVAAHPEFPIEY
ncbi:hypothetical protein LCGC14_2948480, partial [marine sediment metagenome]